MSGTLWYTASSWLQTLADRAKIKTSLFFIVKTRGFFNGGLFFPGKHTWMVIWVIILHILTGDSSVFAKSVSGFQPLPCRLHSTVSTSSFFHCLFRGGRHFSSEFCRLWVWALWAQKNKFAYSETVYYLFLDSKHPGHMDGRRTLNFFFLSLYAVELNSPNLSKNIQNFFKSQCLEKPKLTHL